MTKIIIKLQKLTSANWKDFEKLFGEKGACGGCWCMFWRLRNADFNRMKGEQNKLAMHMLVKADESVGFIAYHKSDPIGWISVSPRQAFIKLDTSRTIKPVDDKPVQSVSCFFLDKKYRSKGLSSEILKLVIAHFKNSSHKILEAYPVNPRKKKMPDAFAWTGLINSYLKAGFEIVSKPSQSKFIVRYYLS
jgi:GNAT superfamily N-acetyltransferase